MRHPRTARRRIGVAFVVAAAAAGIPFMAAAPAQALPSPIEHEGSVTVESFPETKNLPLLAFNDEGGTLSLDKVTVTAEVEGELGGSVENLSGSKSKVYVGLMKTGIVVNGPGVVDLAATAQNATVYNLPHSAGSPLSIGGSDSSVAEITEPAALDAFVWNGVGEVEDEGTLDYEVASEVAVDIKGPAPYKTTGVGGGEATVKIAYEFTDVCVENPSDPVCVVEEPPCVEGEATTITPLKTLAEETFALSGGGTIALTGLNTPTASGESFAWTSTQPVHSIDVKGGPGYESHAYPGGELAGSGLHAPAQVSDPGQWFDIEHLVVCADPVEDCESNPEMEGCDPPECVEYSSFKIEPVGVGDHALPGGGVFTIENKEDVGAGETFDWTSTVPIFWISVKGGPQALPQQFYDYPGGVLAGSDLHAPSNEGSAKWYGLSHITVCVGEVECPPEDPESFSSSDDECDPECPPVLSRTSTGGDDCEPECPPVPSRTSTGGDDCEPECPEGSSVIAGGDECEPECPEVSSAVAVGGECDPEPTCEDDPQMPGCTPGTNQCLEHEGFKVDPVTEGEHGVFTITEVRSTPNGPEFDWTSTVPILSITVKGGPLDVEPEFYSYAPDGATSDEGLHAPLNGNGKWYGLSHLCVEVEEVASIKGNGPSRSPAPAPAPEPVQEPAKEQPPVKVEKAPEQEAEVEETTPEPEPEAAEPEEDPEPQPEPETVEPEAPAPDAAAGQEGGQ